MRELLSDWIEIRRNMHINKVLNALLEHDSKTLDKYPASFVLRISQNDFI